MADARQLIKTLFANNKISIPQKRTDLFDEFLRNEKI